MVNVVSLTGNEGCAPCRKSILYQERFILLEKSLAAIAGLFL
jgi:hypothetical protein